jgi:hypothetical protein
VDRGASVVFYEEDTAARTKEKVGALNGVSCTEAEKRKGGKWEEVRLGCGQLEVEWGRVRPRVAHGEE